MLLLLLFFEVLWKSFQKYETFTLYDSSGQSWLVWSHSDQHEIRNSRTGDFQSKFSTSTPDFIAQWACWSASWRRSIKPEVAEALNQLQPVHRGFQERQPTLHWFSWLDQLPQSQAKRPLPRTPRAYRRQITCEGTRPELRRGPEMRSWFQPDGAGGLRTAASCQSSGKENRGQRSLMTDVRMSVQKICVEQRKPQEEFTFFSDKVSK